MEKDQDVPSMASIEPVLHTTTADEPTEMHQPDHPHTAVFISALYEEKKLHKDHRHKHVLQKLILSGIFIGLGQFDVGSDLFKLSLYIVPFVALVHDAYILAEDYKVKRIGFFLLKLAKDTPSAISPAEVIWERDWLPGNRDWRAMVASFTYTSIITVFTAFALGIHNYHHSNNVASWTIFVIWLLVTLVAAILLYRFGRTIRQEYMKLRSNLN